MFAQHETVELHGLGAAISSAVEVSQYLCATPYAEILKVETNLVQSANAARKPEIVIHLKRTKTPPPRESKVNIPDAEDRVVAALEEDENEK